MAEPTSRPSTSAPPSRTVSDPASDPAWEDVGAQVFDLPGHRCAKSSPALLGGDPQHLRRVAEAVGQQGARVTERLDARRRSPGGGGQAALERDLEIHRLTAETRLLTRLGPEAVLGRMVPEDGSAPVYVGRLGLTDPEGRRLLVDWRAPAAEPFFAATHAHPRGLASRRRYRWDRGRVTDYFDEVFHPDGSEDPASLDDQSAFVASLGRSRTGQMQDVLSTIQADQDAIVRADSRGALVVDGGPGTGKTVVALHRAAYLLHADPRLGARRGGLLVVGPHRPYLAYTADVLPSLGEEGVQTCTLADLVPEGARALPETDPEVARLKASGTLVAAVEPAVALYEEPPTDGLAVSTEWCDAWVGGPAWAEAFASVDPGTPHNEARDQVWDALLSILVEEQLAAGVQLRGRDTADDEVEWDRDGAGADGSDGEWSEGGDQVSADLLRRALAGDVELQRTFSRAWPVLEAADLVGDLWSVPAYLRRCAPGLSETEVHRLQRAEPSAWTEADLPLLDAARRRLGDPGSGRRRRRREAAELAERAAMDRVVQDLVAADDDGEGLVTMLRQPRIREMLVDRDALPSAGPDRLAGPFAHVVVDEAQELTDAEWQMVLSRCPSGSLTIVGDRAQARRGFGETWEERLSRVGLDHVRRAELTVNYRTPEEVMVEAEAVIRAALPDAGVPVSVRRTGVPVHHGTVDELGPLLDRWLAEHPDGTGCVVGAPGDLPAGLPTDLPRSRIRSLPPEQVKGLEFDLVVLLHPASWGAGTGGAVDRYVAMTRATQRLVVLTPPDPGTPHW